ncbi:HAMP domain-containing protein [Nibribacter ruber]|uniref:histidine kinase n=1 Tax=Nibribacter ruber TaxID=2698458 RepID=A0A6P1NZT9_9BACT|nr:ATP-binding protein [Nibribacter ruber]QHL86132.1 HAMP domain-containing protein [Nibribacter ruber]
MKLITTIHLGIGFILLMFCIVTLGYVQQTRQVRTDLNDVLLATSTIKLSESAQKNLIDMETGFRGYLLTGEETFLEPYTEGSTGFFLQLAQLDSLTQGLPTQNRMVHEIREKARSWITTFAEPLRLAKAKAPTSQAANAQYDFLFKATAQKAVGKQLMDSMRTKFSVIEQDEEVAKQMRLEELNNSFGRVNYIAIGLTLLAILAGILVSYMIGKSISRRFIRMTALANSIANGNYQVALVDDRKDEISSLTKSLNKMAAKLQESFAHLTKVNKELDQFAYVVSHDLKAPLRAINNLAEWISEDLTEKDPEIIQNLTMMRGRVHRMENLINGILDYSRVGRKELPTTTFSVQDLLKEATENLSPPAGFKITATTPMPVLSTERTLFYQVLANLLSNAFKYHHLQEGNVQVRCTELADFYQFEVEDDGPGIPQEYHQRVFGMFQTMEARDVKESTGVGLAIVKKIVEEKGGEIWIESEKGQGSIFKFTWPKDKVELRTEKEINEAIA